MTYQETRHGIIDSLADQVPRFDSRDDIGPINGLIERLLRYAQGDPVTYKNVSSANTTAFTTLPDEARARSATCQVIGNPIIYRTDGTTPAAANEQVLAVGTVIEIMGQRTIKGFIFASANANQAFLSVNFYD